jgi:ubiquinone/menaquinone biosynthesis C-methylase UbiE
MLNPFRRDAEPHMLLVGMAGVKLGERVAQIGCAHGGRLAAVARKVGLSGRAVAFVPDDTSARRAQRGAADAGVLVEIETAPPMRLPAEDGAFDLVVVDDTAGLLGTMRDHDRAAAVKEALRILRPGGRVLAIGSVARGLGALLSRAPGGPRFDPGPAFQAAGFQSVRKLAEREGLVFVEGVRARGEAGR